MGTPNHEADKIAKLESQVESLMHELQRAKASSSCAKPVPAKAKVQSILPFKLASPSNWLGYNCCASSPPAFVETWGGFCVAVLWYLIRLSLHLSLLLAILFTIWSRLCQSFIQAMVSQAFGIITRDSQTLMQQLIVDSLPLLGF